MGSIVVQTVQIFFFGIVTISKVKTSCQVADFLNARDPRLIRQFAV